MAASALAVRSAPFVHSSALPALVGCGWCPAAAPGRGMILPALPELKAPTVTTPELHGIFSVADHALYIDHKAREAMSTGSMPLSGMEPWLPRL